MSEKNGVYEISEIYSNTYLINEKTSTMFVLVGENRALVIDCGTGIGDFKSVVESLAEGKPYDVVMTHSHVDHIGGRAQFDKIFVSEADSRYIKEVTMLYRRFYTILNQFQGGVIKNKKFTPVKCEPEAVFVKEGDLFDLGGRTVKIYETPGHTVGSVSLLDVENRTIFIGDIANEFLLMWLPHCTTIDTMIKTIKKLISIDGYDTVWASHHTEPFTRERIGDFLHGAEKIAKKKNSFLPLIARQDNNGDIIIYRKNIIH